MNLCVEIEDACANADTSLVDTICEDMYKFSRERSLMRARLGLCHFSGCIENENIDKLKEFDHLTQQDLCRQINAKLQQSMNVKSNFESFTCQILTSKRGTKKRPRGVVYIRWKKRICTEKLPQSNFKTKCPICFETKPALSLNCGHLFCYGCAPKLRGKTCAICRTFCVDIHPIYTS
jgi:hypothetical protein